MPTAPARRCIGAVGCAAPPLAGRGTCATHTRIEIIVDNRRRGSAAAQGYGARWRHYRLWYLEQYPLCGDRSPSAPRTRDSVCQAIGRLRRAIVVDHVRPVTGPTDPSFFEEAAHQALCASCHNAKRQRERGRR
jgi:5-methylcytosine-specific restriction protein A